MHDAHVQLSRLEKYRFHAAAEMMLQTLALLPVAGVGLLAGMK